MNEPGADPEMARRPRFSDSSRRVGVAAGAGGIALVVAAAVLLGPEAPPPPSAPGAATPVVAAPAAPAFEPDDAPAQDEPQPAPVAAPAAADPPATTASARMLPACPSGTPAYTILVAFAPSHPMHRAQALAADGRREEALRLARQLGGAQAALRGMCVARFTIGGAEIVFAPARAVPAGQADAAAARVEAAIAAMDGVAYAYRNIEVSLEGNTPN